MNSEDKKVIIDIINSLLKADTESQLEDYLQDFPKDKVNIVFEFLKLFGVFQSESFKFTSKESQNFLKVLKLYIEQDLSLISHWELVGAKYNARSHDLFNNGLQFTYELEKRRLNLLRSKQELDTQDITLLVVKAKIENNDDPKYLFQYSTRGHKFQLIGGYKKDVDTSIEDSIDRLIHKELSKNLIKKYSANKIHEQSSYRVSNRTSLYTKFNVSIYQVILEDVDILKLTDNDRWFSIDDMKKEYTDDGKLIMSPLNDITGVNDEKILTILEALPLSLVKVQPSLDNGISREREDINENVLISKLLKEEESEHLEFKSTIRFDLRENKVNKELEKVIIKTIAAFLNSNDGFLIIGIDDDKNILGLDQDIQTLQKKNEDGLMLHLIALINSHLGVEINSFVDISFFEIKSKIICLVDIQKASQPIFVKNGENREFYVRTGNRTSSLNPEETYKYISINW
jgi:hypothetical protein